ncbi:MAG TPA: hypothetical protein VEY30_02460 [Myxococcaceae bacterium]|nr:hypothetical protein [Myxococcaceae bacterium]
MGYRVRSADGEIQFPDFVDLEKAYRAALVDPHDEVLEEGQTRWVKAGDIRLLKGVRAAGRLPDGVKRWYRRGLWFLAACALIALAARWMARAYGIGPWAVVLPLVVLVLAVGLTQMTYRAFRRPHRRR